MKENLHYSPLHVVDQGRLSTTSCEDLRWVVMRSLQNKIPRAVSSEDGNITVVRQYGYECAEHLFCEFFMPMKEAVSVIRGKRVIRREPAIAGLFFVRDTVSRIQELSSGLNGFELKYLKGRKYREPVIINNAEMASFIGALQASPNVRFYSPDDNALRGKLGKRVRVYKDDSYFEGTIMSVRGSRKRWLRIGIEGFMVAELEFNLDELQKSGQVVEVLD